MLCCPKLKALEIATQPDRAAAAGVPLTLPDSEHFTGLRKRASQPLEMKQLNELATDFADNSLFQNLHTPVLRRLRLGAGHKVTNITDFLLAQHDLSLICE